MPAACDVTFTGPMVVAPIVSGFSFCPTFKTGQIVYETVSPSSTS
jgi:hypothetical protein